MNIDNNRISLYTELFSVKRRQAGALINKKPEEMKPFEKFIYLIDDEQLQDILDFIHDEYSILNLKLTHNSKQNYDDYKKTVKYIYYEEFTSEGKNYYTLLPKRIQLHELFGYQKIFELKNTERNSISKMQKEDVFDIGDRAKYFALDDLLLFFRECKKQVKCIIDDNEDNLLESLSLDEAIENVYRLICNKDGIISDESVSIVDLDLNNTFIYKIIAHFNLPVEQTRKYVEDTIKHYLRV